MIKKDFELWWNKKKKLHFWKKWINFLIPWEIAWWFIWVNIWFEQDWKWKNSRRPILIISKIWNMYFWVPLTKQWKDSSIFNHRLKSVDFWFNSDLIISQWRMFDIKRFWLPIWKISKKELDEIKKLLKNKYFPKV